MITAKWKEGFGFYKDADAQTVAEEILSMGEDVSAKQIVDKARDISTELHKLFEWDDGIAAEKYRESQARQIICHLVIQEETVPEDRPEVRYFFKTEPSEGYKPTQTIVRKEDEYKSLLAQAYADLQAFKRKYACLEELREILDLID